MQEFVADNSEDGDTDDEDDVDDDDIDGISEDNTWKKMAVRRMETTNSMLGV